LESRRPGRQDAEKSEGQLETEWKEERANDKREWASETAYCCIRGGKL
jgi:hypothetical protein